MLRLLGGILQGVRQIRCFQQDSAQKTNEHIGEFSGCCFSPCTLILAGSCTAWFQSVSK